MPNLNDVQAAGAGATEDTLLVSALRGKKPFERHAALKELRRRHSSKVRPLLGKIATDAGAPPELRTTAIVALGREAAPENEQVLMETLTADDPAVVAAGAEAVARIGGRKAFDALTKVHVGNKPAAARAVVFAKTLLSYRLGLGAERVREPPSGAMLEVDPQLVEPLRLEPVAPGDVLAARRSLAEELPGVTLSERGSARFRCGGERLWLVLTEQVAGPGRIAVERDAVAAVVLKESECPGGWYVREYVLAHPRGDGSAAVFGGRSTGRVVHFGQLDKDGNLDLRALDAPGALALDLRAAVRAPSDGWRCWKAGRARRRRERRRQPPSPAGRPPGPLQRLTSCLLPSGPPPRRFGGRHPRGGCTARPVRLHGPTVARAGATESCERGNPKRPDRIPRLTRGPGTAEGITRMVILGNDLVTPTRSVPASHLEGTLSREPTPDQACGGMPAEAVVKDRGHVSAKPSSQHAN